MKRLIEKLNSLNTALPGLLLGILLYGLLAEFVAVWFVPDWRKYTIGLWIGIAAAIFMSVHMAVVIADVTDFMTEKQAKAKAVLHAILRYGIVAVAFGLMTYFEIGYVLAALLGVISLKISAYLQPFMQKKLGSLIGAGRIGAVTKKEEVSEWRS
ncbi:MAG: hypothetical protein IJJ13_07060 [Lachnospiraceae bacterium]|nr:hypothetical protein [Lachnospiraceae bacterium]